MNTLTEYIFNNASIEELSNNNVFNELTDCINDLINKDFSQLIQVLYRLDVSEEKLKTILKEKPEEDAGQIIATLIIERQTKKLQARMQEKEGPDNDSEERW